MLLRIYSIDGKLIDTLVDSSLQPGYYHIAWDAHLESSGIYFVNLLTEMGRSQTKKIMLLR